MNPPPRPPPLFHVELASQKKRHVQRFRIFSERSNPSTFNIHRFEIGFTTFHHYIGSPFHSNKPKMKFSPAAVAVAAVLSFLPHGTIAFTPSATRLSKSAHTNSITSNSNSRRFATSVEDEKTKLEEKEDEVVLAAAAVAVDVVTPAIDKDVEGLPWWWDLVWKLDVMKTGVPGTECNFGDSANVLRTNIEQIYGGFESLDGCPLAEGELADIADGTQFIGLQRYQNVNGSPYKLCFGPKSFLVISDPVQAKHILKTANSKYDKGLLAEILEPIMGKGLIPADPETWSVRRRQIVPAFHRGTYVDINMTMQYYFEQ